MYDSSWLRELFDCRKRTPQRTNICSVTHYRRLHTTLIALILLWACICLASFSCHLTRRTILPLRVAKEQAAGDYVITFLHINWTSRYSIFIPISWNVCLSGYWYLVFHWELARVVHSKWKVVLVHVVFLADPSWWLPDAILAQVRLVNVDCLVPLIQNVRVHTEALQQFLASLMRLLPLSNAESTFAFD